MCVFSAFGSEHDRTAAATAPAKEKEAVMLPPANRPNSADNAVPVQTNSTMPVIFRRHPAIVAATAVAVAGMTPYNQPKAMKSNKSPNGSGGNPPSASDTNNDKNTVIPPNTPPSRNDSHNVLAYAPNGGFSDGLFNRLAIYSLFIDCFDDCEIVLPISSGRRNTERFNEKFDRFKQNTGSVFTQRIRNNHSNQTT